MNRRLAEGDDTTDNGLYNHLLQYFFAADEDDRNEVVVKVLQLLFVLVNFGYYDDIEDVKQFLPAVYKLLNGKEDYPTRKIKTAAETSLIDGVYR